MRPARNVKLVSTIIVILFLLSSCTTTVTRVKNPAFNRSLDSLQHDLNGVVSCEKMNLEGKEMTSNGKKSTELVFEIVNGRNIPKDDPQLTILAKKIAVLLKSSMQDKNEFDAYQVSFITEKVNGNFNQTSTTEKTFKSVEL